MSHFSYSAALLLQDHPGNQCERDVHYLRNMGSTPIKLHNPQENISEPYFPLMQSALLVSSLTLLHTKTRTGH